jgi:hypothetical protein
LRDRLPCYVAPHNPLQEIAMSFAPETDNLAKPQSLMRVPVGLASPLWGLFAGVAVSGATWWWMTRWARPENLEAMFGAAAKFETAMETEAAALEAPAVEAAEAATEVAEAVVDALPEPALEAAPEPMEEPMPAPVLEALAEATPDLQPVGGEAAPISPVLEAFAPEPAAIEATPAEAFAEAAGEPAAPPKAKKKAAAPKAD